ncbi:hypothetical protein E2C01_099369 [Portunus trituberculatus]|uniref:Uncharacterized protein n=1 Tax=Portunus trituberculatus TaxID=210409 RepID=A0A5B7KF78_PORTR|nr:hypothetical protein [Portunus trituberculatus]
MSSEQAEARWVRGSAGSKEGEREDDGEARQVRMEGKRESSKQESRLSHGQSSILKRPDSLPTTVLKSRSDDEHVSEEWYFLFIEYTCC